jgi:hypothetical protein
MKTAKYVLVNLLLLFKALKVSFFPTMTYYDFFCCIGGEESKKGKNPRTIRYFVYDVSSEVSEANNSKDFVPYFKTKYKNDTELEAQIEEEHREVVCTISEFFFGANSVSEFVCKDNWTFDSGACGFLPPKCTRYDIALYTLALY